MPRLSTMIPCILLLAIACGDKDDSVDSESCTTILSYTDADGDGLGAPDSGVEACEAPEGNVDNADDCDDSDAAVGLGSDWYPDVDGDGYGNSEGAATVTCEAPEGYVADNEDCDDSDPEAWAVTSGYADADADGYGDPASPIEECGGVVTDGTDCDDTNPDAYPGAEEICGDVDLDCDGAPPVLDVDGDGYETTVCGGEDCDDGDPGVNPGADETCSDVDLDCDGVAPGSESCALASCLDHLNAGETVDGEYTIDPDGANTGEEPFLAYCDLNTDGGGWTLLFSAGTSFDVADGGVTDSGCYSQECSNKAFSTLPIGADMIIDAADAAITGTGWTTRTIITGVDAGLQGSTLQQAMTGAPQVLVEADDNSNVVNPDGCGSWGDYGSLICDTSVITFNDQDSGRFCPGLTHLIGASRSSSTSWDNCAGWPDEPNFGGSNYMPDNFRIWVR